jgi:hypothetical protein
VIKEGVDLMLKTAIKLLGGEDPTTRVLAIRGNDEEESDEDAASGWRSMKG